MRVFDLTQKYEDVFKVLIQKLTQINVNHGTRYIVNEMMKILKNLRNYRDGTMMVPMSIHVALMPYIQD